jgi:predicted metalloendopeptidase
MIIYKNCFYTKNFIVNSYAQNFPFHFSNLTKSQKTNQFQIDWNTYNSRSSWLPDSIRTHLQSNPTLLTYGQQLNQKLNDLYSKASPDLMANYLCAQVASKHAPFLGLKLSDTDAAFRKKVSGGGR